MRHALLALSLLVFLPGCQYGRKCFARKDLPADALIVDDIGEARRTGRERVAERDRLADTERPSSTLRP